MTPLEKSIYFKNQLKKDKRIKGLVDDSTFWGIIHFITLGIPGGSLVTMLMDDNTYTPEDLKICAHELTWPFLHDYIKFADSVKKYYKIPNKKT